MLTARVMGEPHHSQIRKFLQVLYFCDILNVIFAQVQLRELMARGEIAKSRHLIARERYNFDIRKLRKDAQVLQFISEEVKVLDLQKRVSFAFRKQHFASQRGR